MTNFGCTETDFNVVIRQFIYIRKIYRLERANYYSAKQGITDMILHTL